MVTMKTKREATGAVVASESWSAAVPLLSHTLSEGLKYDTENVTAGKSSVSSSAPQVTCETESLADA